MLYRNAWALSLLCCCVDIVGYHDMKHPDISISSLAYDMNCKGITWFSTFH